MNSQTIPSQNNNSVDTEKESNIIPVLEAVPVATVISSSYRISDDDGKKFAQAYQKTGFIKAMDDKNKKALKVAAEKGFSEASTHMMSMAGGDYSRMRSMFG
jgi:hypothetical protein